MIHSTAQSDATAPFTLVMDCEKSPHFSKFELQVALKSEGLEPVASPSDIAAYVLHGFADALGYDIKKR